MHPTGPILAFQLNIPEIFSEALASPAYMVATPMPSPITPCSQVFLVGCVCVDLCDTTHVSISSVNCPPQSNESVSDMACETSDHHYSN